MPKKTRDIIPEKRILKLILSIRGEKVILDSDLAALYGVETRRFNEQARRNIDKFPDDFMFQLTKEEFENLKSQIATSSSGWGGRRKLPFVFTEHGALQVANVLNSSQANKMSVFIVRTFVRLREMALANEKLSRKVDQLEKRVSDHDEILIAEDDFVSRKMLNKLLTPFGEVDCAANGQEDLMAVKMAFETNQPYDLICLDILMPEVDGIMALKKIRQLEAQKGINP